MEKLLIIFLSVIWSQQIVNSSGALSSFISFKPGECPTVENHTLPCPNSVHKECLIDEDCRGDLKCCNVGCDLRCVNPTINKLWRPNECPIHDTETECPEIVSNECIVDVDCSIGKKCCSDGCKLKCMNPSDEKTPPTIEPKLSFKPKLGKCPLFDDPQECPVLVYNDCMLDGECPGKQKCCDTGCRLLCVNDNGTIPSELRERNDCPAAKTRTCSGMSHHQCRWDKQCFGGYKCCFDGCKFTCSGKLKEIPEVVCYEAVDIGFVIDTSGSLNEDVFNLVKYFLAQITGRFEVSNKAAHLSLITFGTSTQFVLSFKKGLKKSVVKDAFEGIPYTQGKSRLDLALIEANKKMFKKHSGMRRYVPKYLIVVSDGRLSFTARGSDVVKAARKMKNKGVEIFSVGVTSDVDIYTMLDIASHPRDLFKMFNYSAVMDYSKRITKRMCKRAAKDSVNTRHL